MTKHPTKLTVIIETEDRREILHIPRVIDGVDFQETYSRFDYFNDPYVFSHPDLESIKMEAKLPLRDKSGSYYTTTIEELDRDEKKIYEILNYAHFTPITGFAVALYECESCVERVIINAVEEHAKLHAANRVVLDFDKSRADTVAVKEHKGKKNEELEV